jgi:hypothetical protein
VKNGLQGQGSHMPQQVATDNHTVKGWWLASDKWRSLERNLLYCKFIHQEFHTVTCCSVRRSQHLTLSKDIWYYIIEITLPVWIWEFSFTLLICMFISCHHFVCLLWNFIFRNLTASFNPSLSTFCLKWNVQWAMQQLQYWTQLNTETWNYA